MAARTRRASRTAPALTREAVLAGLFAELFTADEFHRWLGRDPARKAVLESLPGPTASSAQLFDVAVGAMTRAGLIDDELFERLEHNFPRRVVEIREVATAWSAPDPAIMPTKPRTGATQSPRGGQGGVNIGENARVTVGGHLVGGDLTIESPAQPTSPPRGRGRRPR